MIEQTKAWKVGDKTFATLEEAQTAALLSIIPVEAESRQVVMLIVRRKDEVIDILTDPNKIIKPRKPRSDKGKPHTKGKPLPTGKRYDSVDDLIKDKQAPPR